MAGVCDMGGVSYFNLSIDNADGDLDLLQAVMDGANVEVDPAGEERKGGGGHLGKMFYSAGDKQLAIMCHVPKELADSKNLTLEVRYQFANTSCVIQQCTGALSASGSIGGWRSVSQGALVNCLCSVACPVQIPLCRSRIVFLA